MIEIKDIYKSYKQGDRLVPALKGLSFSLGRGDLRRLWGRQAQAKLLF